MSQASTFNIDPEQYYSVGTVRKLIPSRPSNPTLWRWVRQGIVHGNQRVRLNAIKLGGRRLILGSDLVAFVTALNSDRPTTNIVTPAEYDRRAEAAERRLTEAGV